MFLQASATTLATAHAAQRRRSPNILFFFPDQHRFDWLSGRRDLPLKTPHLDSMARSGIRFKWAFTPSPLCAPARACLASGREYLRCGVRNNGQDYPLENITFYQLLRDAGYHVAGCGKFDLHKATLDWGIDGKRFLPEWGFSDGIDNAGKIDAIVSGAVEARDPYMAYLHRRGLAGLHVDDFRQRTQASSYWNTQPTPLPEEAYCDNWIAQNGLDLLRAAPPGKPWFLQVNFVGPHNPLDITRRMESAARNRRVPVPVESEQYSAERHTAVRQNYSAMVENVDRWLGVYLDEVRRRGELEHTLLVYSSDHGEMLGDHERWGKSVPYQPSTGVPLLVSGPGVRHTGDSDALVSLIDLTATFLDCAGIARPNDMDGISLRPLLQGKATAHRDYVRSGLDRWRMVFDGRYKLILGFGSEAASKSKRAALPPRPVLFDLKLDPEETADLARQAPNQVERLSRLIAAPLTP